MPSVPNSNDLKDGSRQSRIEQKRREYPARTYLESALTLDQVDVLVCLTLYNESSQALAATLAGLARNQLRFDRPTSTAAPRLLVCILLDGENSLAASTRTLLDVLGLSPWRGPDHGREGSNCLNIRHRDLSIAALLGDERAAGTLSVLIASKRDNAGKLDSHAWLFWGVCSRISADYVLQLDAGSVPDPDCLTQLLLHMQCNPACAAVTTHVLVAPPTGWNPSRNWEYGDYLWEKVTDWAIGNAADYLEVVPGQCSMINRKRFCAVGEDGRSALDAYLRGLEPEGLTEHNLFLAEDRVMGFEMAIRTQGGHIHYQPRAGLLTDPAPSFSELVRQRRRWINSTLTARLNAFARIPAMLASGELPAARKAGVLLSLSWGWLSLLAQLCMPICTALLLGFGVAHAIGEDQGDPRPLSALAIAGAFLGLWAGLLLLCRSVGVETACGRNIHRFGISLTGLVLIGAIVLGLPFLNRPILILFAAAMVLLVAAITVHSPRHLSAIARWLPFYLLMLPSFSLYLTTFSIANFCDTSWGTKGLTGRTARTDDHRRWARVRDGLLLAWTAFCVAAVVLCVILIPATSWPSVIRIAISVFTLRVMVPAATSLFCHVYKRPKRPSVAPRSVPEQERA